MESNIKASFIPDNMPTSKAPAGAQQRSSGSAADILVLVAVVALAASLALAAGVFLYDRFLQTSVTRKSEQLDRARQAFEPQLIDELVRLDARLHAADAVLAQHTAPSALFDILEDITLQSVAYESMDYTVGDDNTITIRINGKARSVNAVALQASVFAQNNAIINPIFSDLDLVSDGVTFSVSATINPSALAYATVFAQPEMPMQEFDAFGGDGFGDDAFGQPFNDAAAGEGGFGDFAPSDTGSFTQ